MTLRNCVICKKGFKTYPSHIKNRRAKCCSRKCADIVRRGYKHTPEAIEKIRLASTGRAPWNKNKRCDYLSKLLVGKVDEASRGWKGDNISYDGIHQWVARKLGRPKVCTRCKSTTARRYEWANISRYYRRDLKDWVRLCKSCHEIYDNLKDKERETYVYEYL